MQLLMKHRMKNYFDEIKNAFVNEQAKMEKVIKNIYLYMQHHVDLMQILTRVGDPRYGFLIYFPLAYCFHRPTGTRVLWIACLSEWLNGVLKWQVLTDLSVIPMKK